MLNVGAAACDPLKTSRPNIPTLLLEGFHAGPMTVISERLPSDDSVPAVNVLDEALRRPQLLKPGAEERLIREAIELHLEGMAEDGLPIPEPSTEVEYVEVNA